MDKSIPETLRKINMELKGPAFLSIFLSFLIVISFLGYKILSSPYTATKKEVNYIKSNFAPLKPSASSTNSHFIYASKQGSKYYYYNCKSTIKEGNKIYFDSDASALKAGYTLAKACQ